MFKLSRRENLIPFFVFLGAGLAASILLPPMFAEAIVEIPAFTLFPAEIALVLILSVLFFENATPAELLRLSFTMLAISMGAGALCNVISMTTQSLPDSTLLLNWVQLIAMNVTGMLATITLYQSKASVRDQPVSALREVAPKPEPVPVIEGDIPKEIVDRVLDQQSGESAKDILEKLDIRRIEQLESSLQSTSTASGSNVSLEELFADESRAAAGTSTNSAAPVEEAKSGGGGLDDLFGTKDTGEFKMPAAPAVPEIPAEPPAEAPPKTETKKSRPEPVTLDQLKAGIKKVQEEEKAAKDKEPAAVQEPEGAPKFFEAPAAKADDKAVEGKLFDDVSSDLDDIFSNLAAPEALQEVSPETLKKTDAPAEIPVAETAEAKGGLFDDVSSDLDDIFSNLAAPEALQEVSPETLKKTADAPPESMAETVQVDTKGLFDDVSSDLDDIFSNLASPDALKEVSPENLKKEEPTAVEEKPTEAPATPVEAQPAAVAEVPPSAEPQEKAPADLPKPDMTAAPAAREVKEFGRLSSAATSKIELATPGTLKTIGQMLLDTQAVENIIKHSGEKGDTMSTAPTAATAKVVTVSRGADIQAMLDKLAAFPGINGSLVIGKDGLLIGATESLGMMRDVYGVLALGVHSTTGLGTKKVDLGELRQMVLKTGEKLTILNEVGIGVLAVFCDVWNTSALNGILEHIEKTVNESQNVTGAASLPTQTLGANLFEQADAQVAPPPSPVAEPDPAPAPAALPEPTPAPVAEAPQPAADATKEGGLLNVSDVEIGDLFDGLLEDPKTAVRDVGSPPAEAPAAAAAAAPASSMDFSPPESQKPAEPDAPAAPAAPATPVADPKSQATAAPTQQIKEFGRLSAGSGSATSGGANEGAIKAIGRQLIDVQAVENIIKAGEKREKMGIGAGLTTARVISAARGEGIKTLLTKIDNFPGVAGSLIVGNDGLVIASTLTSGLDKDLLGALCNAMHSHSDLAAKKLDMGKLRQIIFHADDKMTILTGVAVGVLAVFVENRDLTQVDSLLTAIESTVRG